MNNLKLTTSIPGIKIDHFEGPMMFFPIITVLSTFMRLMTAAHREDFHHNHVKLLWNP